MVPEAETGGATDVEVGVGGVFVVAVFNGSDEPDEQPAPKKATILRVKRSFWIFIYFQRITKRLFRLL